MHVCVYVVMTFIKVPLIMVSRQGKSVTTSDTAIKVSCADGVGYTLGFVPGAYIKVIVIVLVFFSRGNVRRGPCVEVLSVKAHVTFVCAVSIVMCYGLL
jgi:hypothetical protein